MMLIWMVHAAEITISKEGAFNNIKANKERSEEPIITIYGLITLYSNGNIKVGYFPCF